MTSRDPENQTRDAQYAISVSYTHLRAHETKANLVCRLLLEIQRMQISAFRGQQGS